MLRTIWDFLTMKKKREEIKALKDQHAMIDAQHEQTLTDETVPPEVKEEIRRRRARAKKVAAERLNESGGVLVLLAVVFSFCAGCGLTPQQREELIDTVATRAAGELSDVVREKIVPEIKAKAGEAIAKAAEKAAELVGVSPEKVAEIVQMVQATANQAVDEVLGGEIIAARLEPVARSVLERIVPEADEDTSSVGGIIGAGILALLQGFLGMKRT